MMRTFFPGTEWLYLKIYTGIKTADIILQEVMHPLVEFLHESNHICKWFFIRYHDPKPHLRIRFCLNNSEDCSKVLNIINSQLYDFIESGEVSSVIADTYIREIERYGKNTIIEAETLFYKNSEFTLKHLQYNDEEKIIILLYCIDQILNKLNLSIQQKFEWITVYNDAFKKEFNADKKLNSQLDKKYREFKPKYLHFIESNDYSEERNIIISYIDFTSSILQKIVEHHQYHALQSFFQSIFHMNINRIFISKQRLFEMIIYDYLVRHYKSLIFFKL